LATPGRTLDVRTTGRAATKPMLLLLLLQQQQQQLLLPRLLA